MTIYGVMLIVGFLFVPPIGYLMWQVGTDFDFDDVKETTIWWWGILFVLYAIFSGGGTNGVHYYV